MISQKNRTAPKLMDYGRWKQPAAKSVTSHNNKWAAAREVSPPWLTEQAHHKLLSLPWLTTKTNYFLQIIKAMNEFLHPVPTTYVDLYLPSVTERLWLALLNQLHGLRGAAFSCNFHSLRSVINAMLRGTTVEAWSTIIMSSQPP